MKNHLDRVSAGLGVGIAMAWSVWQFAAASPLFSTPGTTSIILHLAFALLLCFTYYKLPEKYLFQQGKLANLLLTAISIIVLYYTFTHSERLIISRESWTVTDYIIALLGLALIVTATIMIFEKPVLVFTLLFLAFAVAATVIFHFAESKEESLNEVIFYLWYSNEGVFSGLLRMSHSTIFIFMLFSVLLSRIGTIHYLSLISFYCLRKLIGGSAKSLLFASGLGGAISGPDVSGHPHLENLPPDLADDFSRENTKLTESSAKIFSQILPPILGVGAFLMVDYANVTYVEILKSILIPAIITFIISLYLVHQSALKFHSKTIGQEKYRKIFSNLALSCFAILLLVATAGIIYFSAKMFDRFFDNIFLQDVFAYFVIIYVGLIWLESGYPELEGFEIDMDRKRYPKLHNAILSGLHSLLPVVFLILSLNFNHETPQYSGFFSTLFVIIILLTRKTLRAIFRKQKKNIIGNFLEGLERTGDGLKSAAVLMVPVALTLALSGMFIEIISLTGLGEIIARILENHTYESFILAVFYTMVICLLLSAKLDITISFIIVSYICTPVLMNIAFLGSRSISIITVNLFIFFCCVIAACFAPLVDITVNRKGGIGNVKLSGKINYESLKYACCFLVIPIIFISNQKLLLLDVKSFPYAAFVFLQCLAGATILLASFNRYLFIRNTKVEAVLLLIIGITVLYPRLWIDTISPPYKMIDGTKVLEIAEENPMGKKLMLVAEGIDDIGEVRKFNFIVTLGDGDSGEQRLKSYGIVIDTESEPSTATISEIMPRSHAETDGISSGFRIIRAGVENKQPSPLIPMALAFMLLGITFMKQILRARKIFNK